MASIKVLKNGIVHSFGLHTDASVTNGNYIYVNINGTTHYARIGDNNTPLKVKKTDEHIPFNMNLLILNDIIGRGRQII